MVDADARQVDHPHEGARVKRLQRFGQRALRKLLHLAVMIEFIPVDRAGERKIEMRRERQRDPRYRPEKGAGVGKFFDAGVQPRHCRRHPAAPFQRFATPMAPGFPLLPHGPVNTP